MFRVYDKEGTYVDVNFRIDVKELLKSGMYVRFEDFESKKPKIIESKSVVLKLDGKIYSLKVFGVY